MAKPLARDVTVPGRAGLHPQTVAGMLVLVAAGLLVLTGSRVDPEVGIFGVLGVCFGVALQRSRFCFNSAFRDLLQFQSGRTMKGVIVGMAVATAGFGLHMHNLLPNPFLGPVAPEAHAAPLSLALIVGGVLFGIGMVVAGGCTSILVDHPPAVDTIRMAANRLGLVMEVQPEGSGEWRIRLRRRSPQEVSA